MMPETEEQHLNAENQVLCMRQRFDTRIGTVAL